MDGTYKYDTLARLTKITYNDAQSTLLAEMSWTFDTLNRVEKFTHKFLTAPSTWNIDTSDYNYDATQQLIGVVNSASTSDDEDYVYDLNGNRALVSNESGTNKQYVTGDNNYLLSDGTYAYTYVSAHQNQG